MKKTMQLLWLTVVLATAENPIRKVVNLLQGMQKEIEAEGSESKEAYEKFMCYCNSNIEQINNELSEATETSASLASTIKGNTGVIAQIDSELGELKKDLAENQKSLEEASSTRAKEADAFQTESTELKTNIGSLDVAIPKLEQGLSLTQRTAVIEGLKALLIAEGSQPGAQGTNARSLMQISEGTESPEIVGMLKQMRDDMKKNLAGIVKDEEEAVATFDKLSSSKKAEIEAAQAEIGELTGRSATVTLELSDAKRDLEKTKKASETSQNKLIDLKKACDDRSREYETLTKERQIELKAIGQAVKILNDDSALDLFKKTLPSPTGFLQSRSSSTVVQDGGATDSLDQDDVAADSLAQIVGVSFVEFRGRHKEAPSLEPVKKIVTNMKVSLQEEQTDDTEHLKWCKGELRQVEETLKETSEKIEGLQQSIAEANTEKEAADEAKVRIEEEMAASDKAVEEATKSRQSDHETFSKQSADQNMAIQLLEKAKVVLAKVYSSGDAALVATGEKVGKVPAKEIDSDSSMEDMLGISFVQTGTEVETDELDQMIKVFGEASPGEALVQVTATTQSYAPKTAEGGGVMALMSELVHDIELEMAEMKHDEDEAQADYEKFLAESANARKSKATQVTAKLEVISRIDAEVQEMTKNMKSVTEEKDALLSKEKALHENCDFIIANFDGRMQARSSEMDALDQSNAILSGAKFSLAQKGLRR